MNLLACPKTTRSIPTRRTLDPPPRLEKQVQALTATVSETKPNIKIGRCTDLHNDHWSRQYMYDVKLSQHLSLDFFSNRHR